MDTASWEENFSVIWVDNDLLVVDKPSGIPVLPDGWDTSVPFLKELLEKHYGRLWTVHRLDRGTSGVIVFARSALAHRDLNRQFEQRQVKKTYHALVQGSPRWEHEDIRLPLLPNVGRRHRTVVDSQNGKPAQTQVNVLTRYSLGRIMLPDEQIYAVAPQIPQLVALVEALPLTGRTHQIRVHLAAVGHPILADELYHPQEGYLAIPGLYRLALHAFSLEFTHPVRGGDVCFEVPFPVEIKDVIDNLNKN